MPDYPAPRGGPGQHPHLYSAPGARSHRRTGDVSTATACLLPGSVADGVAILPADREAGYSVEHPTGEFTVRLDLTQEGGTVRVGKSGVIRTARLLSRGKVFIPVIGL